MCSLPPCHMLPFYGLFHICRTAIPQDQRWEQVFRDGPITFASIPCVCFRIVSMVNHSCAGAASNGGVPVRMIGMVELIVDWYPEQVGIAMVCDCASVFSSVSGTPWCQQSDTVSHIWGIVCALNNSQNVSGRPMFRSLFFSVLHATYEWIFIFNKHTWD
jgi:hypothetical protein